MIKKGLQAYKTISMISSAIEAAAAVTNIIAEICATGKLDIVVLQGEGRKAFIALRQLRWASQIQISCFAAGTPLRTPTGHKLIEDVQVGDVLLSATRPTSRGY